MALDFAEDAHSEVSIADEAQAEPELPVVMSPPTASRKTWNVFYGHLDKLKCSYLEKAIFRYCAERPDLEIPLHEILAYLRTKEPDISMEKVDLLCSLLAEKVVKNSRSGFWATYDVGRQTLTYERAAGKTRPIDFKKGTEEVDRILGRGRNPHTTALRERREEEAFMAEIMGETEDRARGALGIILRQGGRNHRK